MVSLMKQAGFSVFSIRCADAGAQCGGMVWQGKALCIVPLVSRLDLSTIGSWRYWNSLGMWGP